MKALKMSAGKKYENSWNVPDMFKLNKATVPTCDICGDPLDTFYDKEAKELSLKCSNRQCRSNRASGKTRYEILKENQDEK